MIACSDFLAEIGNYLEDDVAPDVRAQLEAHLKHCSSCTVLVDSTRKTLKVVTDSGSFELDQSAVKPLADSILARIRGSRTGRG
jgi:hypothetical protein